MGNAQTVMKLQSLGYCYALLARITFVIQTIMTYSMNNHLNRSYYLEWE